MTEREASSYVPSFAKGLSILVVDEDELSLACLSSMMKTLTFNVATSAKATEAIRMICEKSDRFKLVLASVTLSDVKCTTFLRFLLSKNIPLVVMFPEPNVTDAIKFLSEGAIFCLDKPISLDDLKNIWQHAFRKRKKVTYKTLNPTTTPNTNAPPKPPLPPPITTPPTTTTISNPPSSAAVATTPVSRPRANGIVIGKEQEEEAAPKSNGPTIDPKDTGKKISVVEKKKKKNRRKDGWVYHEMMKRANIQAQEERMRNMYGISPSVSGSATLPLSSEHLMLPRAPESGNNNNNDDSNNNNTNNAGGSGKRGNENERENGDGSVRVYGGRRKVRKNSSKKNGSGDGDEKSCGSGTSSEKRARMIWTKNLQNKFMKIMNFLGPNSKVKPNTILDLMEEPTLTLSQVASHLQKYKSLLREHRERRNANRSNVQITVPSQDNIFHQQNSSVPYQFGNGGNANGSQGNVVSVTSTGTSVPDLRIPMLCTSGNQNTVPLAPFGQQQQQQQLGSGNVGDTFMFSAECNAANQNSTFTYDAPVPLTRTDVPGLSIPILYTSGSQTTVPQAPFGQQQQLGSGNVGDAFVFSAERNAANRNSTFTYDAPVPLTRTYVPGLSIPILYTSGSQTTVPQAPFGQQQQLGSGNVGDAFVFSANRNVENRNSTSTYSDPVPLTQTNVLGLYMPHLYTSGSQKTVSQATTLGRKQGLGLGSSYARLFGSGYRNTGRSGTGSVGILEALFTEKEQLQPNNMLNSTMFPTNSAHGNLNASPTSNSAYDSTGLSGSFGQSRWPYSSGQWFNSGLVPNTTTLPSSSSHLSQNYPPNYFSGYQNTVPDMTFGQTQGAVTSAGGNYNPRNVPNTLMLPTSTTDVNINISPTFTSGHTSILPQVPLDQAEDLGNAQNTPISPNSTSMNQNRHTSIFPPMPPDQAEDLAAAVEKFLSGNPQNTRISPNSSNMNQNNLPSLHLEQSEVLEQIHPSNSTNEPVLATNFNNMNRSWDTAEAASPNMNQNNFSALTSGYQETVPSAPLEQSRWLDSVAAQVHSSSPTNEPVVPTNFNSMNRSLATVEVASPTENLRNRVSNLTLDSPAPVEEDDFLLKLDYLFQDYDHVSTLDPPPPQSPKTQLEPQLNMIQVQLDTNWDFDNEFPLLNLGDQFKDHDHVPILDPPPPLQSRTKTQLTHPSNVIEISSDSSEDLRDEFRLDPEDYSELMGSAVQRNNLYL